MDMQILQRMVGIEHDLTEVPQALQKIAHETRPATVGAMLLTCSDESEHECEEAFQRTFVRRQLPSLKFATQAPFRGANLGGRFEWNALRLTENHFSTPESSDQYKLLVIKINSHVSKSQDESYGEAERYHATSHYCGALRALLNGEHGPALDSLRETFESEGLDRLKAIREHVSKPLQPLALAIVNARLQARKAVLESQDFEPHTPTIYLVLSCVTLNRPDRDSELLCGFYEIDRRESRTDSYFGLGDDPSRYQITHENSRLHVSGPSMESVRPARNHRELIREVWEERKPPEPDALQEARAKRHMPGLAKPLLKAAVAALFAAAGVPTALLLFGDGMVGIHHAWRAHRLVKKAESQEDTRKILEEFEERLDTLPPERAEQVLDALLAEYGK